MLAFQLRRSNCNSKFPPLAMPVSNGVYIGPRRFLYLSKNKFDKFQLSQLVLPYHNENYYFLKLGKWLKKNAHIFLSKKNIT